MNNQSQSAQAAQIIARCRTLATKTETPGETTRTFLAPPMHEVHRLLAEWMQAANMTVQVDAIGNIRGLLGHPDQPRLLIASHLDTVPNAGAFDGILGVMLGLAVAESFDREAPPIAIEVIGFSEEEGVRFRRPFLGSMALVGTLDASDLILKDADGITLDQAIRNFNLDPNQIPEARLSPNAKAYLELHIEQGPILESLNLPLGVVTALVGQTRLEFTFEGQSNHAGTTPMHLRHDALATAAEWLLSVEQHARQTEGLVATVGRVETHPGAGNVIPGKVTALLDIRHAGDQARAHSLARLIEAATKAAASRGVATTHRLLLDQPAVALDPTLTGLLASSAPGSIRMTSGAGHDAMILAPYVPTAMLFLRSPGGVSHHPSETVLEEDVEAALAAGIRFVKSLADSIKSASPGASTSIE